MFSHTLNWQTRGCSRFWRGIRLEHRTRPGRVFRLDIRCILCYIRTEYECSAARIAAAIHVRETVTQQDSSRDPQQGLPQWQIVQPLGTGSFGT